MPNKLNSLILIISGLLLVSFQAQGQANTSNPPGVHYSMTVHYSVSEMSHQKRGVMKKISEGKPLNRSERMSLIGQSYSYEILGQKQTSTIKTLDDVDRFLNLKKALSVHQNKFAFRLDVRKPKSPRGGKAGLIVTGAATLLSLVVGETTAAVAEDDHVEFQDVEVSQ